MTLQLPTPQKKQLQIQPVMDAFANCSQCGLAPQKLRKQHCYAYIPTKKPFNGLMIVGEGPGRNEVIDGRPFVGRSGQLLRALCSAESIDLDACYITNATLCRPEGVSGDKIPLYERFPTAIHSCLPRLEEEIARVRPRVIVALGAVAMAALTGTEEKYVKREPFSCDHCDPKDRKVQGMQCAKGDCKHVWEAPKVEQIRYPGGNAPDPQSLALACVPPEQCPKCAASWKRLKVRRVPCPKCKGRKVREVEATRFDWEYNLSEIAGAIIPAEKYGWCQYGVKYVIATFHPSFLLHQANSKGSGEKKVMAGQFAAKAVQRHLRKAKVLLERDENWTFDYEVTSNQDEDAAAHVREYFFDGWERMCEALHVDPDKDRMCGRPAAHFIEYEHMPVCADCAPHMESPIVGSLKCPYNFSADIETEAWGAVYVCRECKKKSGITKPVGRSGWGPATRANLWVRLHAEILDHGWCKECGKHTVQDATLGELDARIIENVSNIKVIGFNSRRRGHALVVDTRYILESPSLAMALREVLADHRIDKTFQNGLYDVIVIRKLWDIVVAGYVDDTLQAHHVACPDETHSLSHLGFKYTYARVWKPPKQLKGHAAHETFEELCLYNARDVVVTDDVREVLAAERVRKGNSEAVYRLDMKLQQQAVEMQWNGMGINLEIAAEVGAKAIGQRNEGLQLMREILRNDQFNPNNPQQLRHALYDVLAYPVTAWTAGGKDGTNKQPSTAKEHILRLEDTPFKRALLLYSEGYDVLKQYFDISRGVAVPGRSIRIWDDGRMHASWYPLARSGRWVSSPNFQNWPGWLRKMIVAPKGRKIVGADYDQLELRIVAALANDPVLIKMCLNADDKRKLEPECDPHSFVASVAFGETYTKLNLKDPNHVKDNLRCKCETCTRKAYRDICKRVIYGMNYGAGEQTVLEAIYNGGYFGPPLKLEMLVRVKHAIYKAFARIPVWREETYQQAVKDQAIFSAILKRWRTFPLGDISPTEISNYPIQSTGADIMNLRNTEFYEQHAKQIDPTSMFLAQVHDAVYYEVDEDSAEVFAEQLTKSLTWETELVPGGQVMLFSAGAKISENWKEAA